MRALHFRQNLSATFGRKAIAILVMSAVMAFNLGPLEAKAADTVVQCSVSGSFIVSDSDGKVVVRHNDRCFGEAVIPANVTEIAPFAFANNRLTALTFAPNSSITFIGTYAFTGTDLTSVELPASLITIGQNAFVDNGNFKSLTFAAGSKLQTIQGGAFYGTRLTSVSFPDSLVTLGNKVFAETRLLTQVTFGAGSQLTSIGEETFAETSLSSIVLPASLVTLGDYAFRDTPTLTQVTFAEGSKLTTIGDRPWNSSEEHTIDLPATVSSIGCGIFGKNTRVNIDEDNPNFIIDNGVLFNTDRTTLVSYAGWLTDATYAIPESVSDIGRCAFQYSPLQSINIPASVLTMGNNAFENSKLQSINIPATVLTMGDNAFTGTQQLTEVTFSPNSPLTKIPAGAFGGSGILSIQIPANVVDIWRSAFRASKLEQLTFEPNSRLVTIGDNAFRESRIKSLEIPATVDLIREWAFYANPLTSVTFEQGSKISVIGGQAFGETALTSFPLPAPPVRSGYDFTGWTEGWWGTTPTENPERLVLQGSALHALWSAVSYPVTFNSNGGSVVSAGSFAGGGNVVDPSAPTRGGYSFVGWSATDGGSAVSFPYAPGVTTGITMFAKWSADSHVVTFDSKSGSAVSAGSFVTGGSLDIPFDPSRAGYSFLGWSATDGGSAVSFPYSPGVTTGVTLYALWSADSHQVDFDSKSGSAVSAGSFVTAGSVAAPSAPTRVGYNFAGWSATDGGSAVEFPYSPGVISDITLYALWSEITAPSVPLNVRATAGNRTATVSWEVPASNGGGSIISYLVTASSGQTCSVVVLTCVVTGLVNKTGVTFTVQAINLAGSGTPSAPSASVTPYDPDDVLPPEGDGDSAPKVIASTGKFVTSNDPTLLFSWSKSTGKLVSNATGKYTGYIEAKMSFTKAGKVHTCSTVFGDLKVLPQKTAAQKAAAMKTKTFAGNPFCMSKIKMDAKSLDPKGGMTAANFKKIKSTNKTSAELAKEKAALTALKGFTGVVEVDVVRYRAWPTTMLNFGDHTGKGGKIPAMIRNTKISLG